MEKKFDFASKRTQNSVPSILKSVLKSKTMVTLEDNIKRIISQIKCRCQKAYRKIYILLEYTFKYLSIKK